MKLSPMGIATLCVVLLFGLALASPVSLAPAVIDCVCHNTASTPTYFTVPAGYDCACHNTTSTRTSSTAPAGYGSPDQSISSTSTVFTTIVNSTSTTTVPPSSTEGGSVIPVIPLVSGSTAASTSPVFTTIVNSTSTTTVVPSSTRDDSVIPVIPLVPGSTTSSVSQATSSPTATSTFTATSSPTTSHQTPGSGDTTSNSTGSSSPASSLVTSTGVTTSTDDQPTSTESPKALSSALSTPGGTDTSTQSSQSTDTSTTVVAGIILPFPTPTPPPSLASTPSGSVSSTSASTATDIHSSTHSTAQPAYASTTDGGPSTMASSTDQTASSSTNASSSGSMPPGVGFGTVTSATSPTATSASGSTLTDSAVSSSATATMAATGTTQSTAATDSTGTMTSAGTITPVGTTVTTGTAISMSQFPSATASPSTEPDFHGFLVPLMFVEIDGQHYTGLTPDSDPLDVILSDGTFATISEHSITVDGESAQLPDLANLTPEGTVLSVNGWPVRVTEAEYNNAHFDPKAHGGLDLFTFFGNAITKISAAADSAVYGVSKIAGTIMGDALAVSAAELAGTPGVALDGLELTGSAARAALATGGQALDDFAGSVEMMDLSLNMVNTDLANGVLDPRIARTGVVFNSIKPSALRTILNEVKNLKNIIKILAEAAEDVAPKVVTALRGKYKRELIISTGGIFSAFIVQLYTTRDKFPPIPPPVNSTRNSTEPTKKPYDDTEWKWFAQTDLPIPLFHLFTKLFDGDEGIKSNAILGIHTSGPTYYTTMNDSVAELLKGFPMIAYMSRMMTWEEQIEYTENHFRLAGATEHRGFSKRRFPKRRFPLEGRHQVLSRDLVSGTPVYRHQALMSMQKRQTYEGSSGFSPFTYTRDESDGDGATIFILDSGIDVSTPGLEREFRSVGKPDADWIYQVPQALLVPDPSWLIPTQGWNVCPESLGDSSYNPWSATDDEGHGTSVAALAAGTFFGIAPKANIYSIKWLECIKKVDSQGNTEIKELGTPPSALRAATSQIEWIVKNRNLQGKAVLNMAWSKVTARQDHMINDPAYAKELEIEDEFIRLRQVCADNGIIMVAAAGNDGNWPLQGPNDAQRRTFLGEHFPQRYSNSSNEVIVVGGTWDDGQLWTYSTQPGIKKLTAGRPPVVIQDPLDSRLGPNDLLGNVDIYAQADEIDVPLAGGGIGPQSGTSLAAPQVAGLIAYLLMKPDTRRDWVWDEQRNSVKLWGTRMKEKLRDLSWQHVKDADIIPWDARSYPWNTPTVNYAYNGAWGPQRNEPWPTATSTATWVGVPTPTPTATVLTTATEPEASSVASTSDSGLSSSVDTSPLSSSSADMTTVMPEPSSQLPAASSSTVAFISTASSTSTSTSSSTSSSSSAFTTLTTSSAGTTSSTSTSTSSSTSSSSSTFTTLTTSSDGTTSSSSTAGTTSSSTTSTSTSSSSSIASTTTPTTTSNLPTVSYTVYTTYVTVGPSTTVTPPVQSTPTAIPTDIPAVVLGYEFFYARQTWSDGTLLCYWVGASYDSRVDVDPNYCEIRGQGWDYTTAHGGAPCDDPPHAYDVTPKWYNTDAWGWCAFNKVSDDFVSQGVIVGTLTGCTRPGAPSMIYCKRAWRLTEGCYASTVPWHRDTLAMPVISCEFGYSS